MPKWLRKLLKRRMLRNYGVAPSVQFDPRKFSRLLVREDLGVVFDPMPKCASTSIRDALNGISRGKKPTKYKKFYSLPPKRGILVVDFVKVTSVRNPFSRVLSAFLELSTDRRAEKYGHVPGVGNRTREGFGQFVRYLLDGGINENKHWKPLTDLLVFPVADYDYVLHLETLNADWDDFCVKQGFLSPKNSLVGPRGIDQKKKGKVQGATNHLRSFYTTKLEKEILKLYEKDFENFGYDTTLKVLFRGTPKD